MEVGARMALAREGLSLSEGEIAAGRGSKSADAGSYDAGLTEPCIDANSARAKNSARPVMSSHELRDECEQNQKTEKFHF